MYVLCATCHFVHCTQTVNVNKPYLVGLVLLVNYLSMLCLPTVKYLSDIMNYWH